MSKATSIVPALLVLSAAACANPATQRTDDHTREAGREAGRTIVGIARDERGNPMQVKLAIDSNNPNPSFKWSSDAAGSFRIPGVPLSAEDLDLIYEEDDGEVGSYPLPTGSEPMSLVIYKHPGIAVTVVDAEGRRLHNIRVTAQRVGSPERPEDIYDPERDEQGAMGLDAGRYVISAPEHPTIVAQTVEILPFHPIQLTLHQRGGATLVVRIVDRDGDRFEEQAYLVKGRTAYPRDDQWEQLSPAEPDKLAGSQGVVFGGLDPGVYTVLLPVPDCKENVALARPVSVTRGANRVSIKLPFVYSECP